MRMSQYTNRRTGQVVVRVLFLPGTEPSPRIHSATLSRLIAFDQQTLVRSTPGFVSSCRSTGTSSAGRNGSLAPPRVNGLLNVDVTALESHLILVAESSPSGVDGLV